MVNREPVDDGWVGGCGLLLVVAVAFAYGFARLVLYIGQLVFGG